MLWNFASAGLLLWLSRRYKEDMKPGTIFAGWLVLAGIGRVIIEFFRPDQPKISSLGISYSSLFAALMAIAGAILLMARYKAISLKFAENWEEEYERSERSSPAAQVSETVEGDVEPGKSANLRKAPRTRSEPTAEEAADAAKMRMDKLLGRRPVKTKETTPPTKKS
jgi:hypothetical protein